MSSPAIEFDNVWKKFRKGERHDSLRDLIPNLVRRAAGHRGERELEEEEFWVLRDVSFQVQPGEALGIIGRNGAGKSTTLKLLTKILKPTKGLCAVRGRVGALIEVAAGFHPDLTGRENVFLQGAIMGMRRHEVVQKLDSIVEFAGLGDFMDTQVKRYSSGMNARLGFSVAAHLDPDVLLIDEVLAVGDMAFQQKCMERLAEFRRRGVSVAFVSHNMQAIAALCDRALLLRPGLSPIVGPVGEVVASYASAGAAHGDPRIRIDSIQLTNANGVLNGPVSPGEELTLSFQFSPAVDLPNCALQFLVTRSDGLRIFDGLSFTDGLSPRDCSAGVAYEVSVRFHAHLLRGTFSASVTLMEEHKRWTGIQLPSLASFVVSESTRWGGVAELEPDYRFHTVAR